MLKELETSAWTICSPQTQFKIIPSFRGVGGSDVEEKVEKEEQEEREKRR